MLSQNEGNRDAASSDKVYAGEFSARQRGDCRVFLTARGVVDSGNLFVRAASVGFIVVPDSARLGSIHESTTRNQMDLIQNVTVTADVAVKNPGKYEFQINFVSTDGLRSIFARAEKMLGAGSQQIGAQFPATDLQTLGDGPYLRRGVRLRRLDAREPIDQDVDWIEDAGASSGYRAADIDRGAFYFTGSRSVTTWKSDTHATLDGIRITLGLFSPGGDCVWSGKLSDGAGKTVATSARYDTLPSGLTIIPLEFQGYQIAQSHKAGPYKLSSVRVTCKGARHELFSSSDSISVLTPPYTASQFTYVARDAVIVGPPVLTIVRGSAPQTVTFTADSTGGLLAIAHFQIRNLPTGISVQSGAESFVIGNSPVPIDLSFHAEANTLPGTYPIILELVYKESEEPFAAVVRYYPLELVVAPQNGIDSHNPY